jgi:hypothetical protein
VAGHEAPTTNPVVRDALRAIRRTVGTAPRKKAAATADRIRAMLDACPDTMIGIRDRAQLALGLPGRSGAASWWRCRSRTSRRSQTATG